MLFVKKCLTGLNYNSQNNGEVDPDIFLINSINGTFVVISLTNHVLFVFIGFLLQRYRARSFREYKMDHTIK